MIECDKCRSKAVIHQKYSGMHLCPAHFTDDAHRKIRESIRETRVFARSARVAVALSGGKDSSVLLYALKDIFARRMDIEFIGIMIDEGIDGYSPKALDFAKALAKSLDVPYVIKSIADDLGATADDTASRERSPVPYSRSKDARSGLLDGLLNRIARDLDADALATGHNLDDEALSVLLSYLRGDIDGLFLLSPCRSSPEAVRRFKPLRRVPDEETALYAALHGLGHIDPGACHCAADAMSIEVKEALNNFEAGHPGTKYSMLRSLDRLLALRRDSDRQNVGPNRF